MSAVFAYPKQAFLGIAVDLYGNTASINTAFAWNAYSTVSTVYEPLKVRGNLLINSTLCSFEQEAYVAELNFRNTVYSAISLPFLMYL